MSDIKNLQYPLYIDVILRCKSIDVKKKNLKVSASCFVKVTVTVFNILRLNKSTKKMASVKFELLVLKG